MQADCSPAKLSEKRAGIDSQADVRLQEALYKCWLVKGADFARFGVGIFI